MKEAPYNKGRTIKDISSKTYGHGNRAYLRPDTMWSDERYIDVTQEEIDAAKARHIERLKAKGQSLTAPMKEINTHADPRYAYEGNPNRHLYAEPISKH